MGREITAMTVEEELVQDVGGSAELVALFRQVSFGDFEVEEMEKLIDVSGLVPYQTYWQSPVPKVTTSMLFGSISVNCSAEVLASTPTFETPVFIGGSGPISPPPLPEYHLFASLRRLSGSRAAGNEEHAEAVAVREKDKPETDNAGVETVATPSNDGGGLAPAPAESEPPSLEESIPKVERGEATVPAEQPSRSSSHMKTPKTEATAVPAPPKSPSARSEPQPKSPLKAHTNGSPTRRKHKRKSQHTSPIQTEAKVAATAAEPTSTAKSSETPIPNGVNGVHTHDLEPQTPPPDVKPSQSQTPPARSPSPKKLFVDTTTTPAPPPATIISPVPSSPTKSSSSGSEPELKSPAPTAPKRWADLIKTPASAAATPIANGRVTKVAPMKAALPKKSIGAIIADIGVSYQTHLVHPRGLINRGNLCFINAILQPLLHTAPFYNAFRKLLLETTPKMITSAPLLDAMLRFWAEFHEDTPGSKLQLTEGDDPTAFAPEYVYTAVRKLRKIDAQQKGRQEDAEEFLGFIIDGLHEELVSLQKEEGSAEAKSPDSDGSWVEVGKTGKNLVTRNVRVETSPVNAIFGGRLRSVVKCPGRKDSVTTEPFQALQLDIAPNHVHTISDALQHLHALETLEGFTSPTKSNRLGTATKQNFLEVLPPVLILHLKRFVYDADKGVGKLGKFVGYDSVLRIPTELMPAPLRPTAKHIEYRLTAVVYHHGAHAAGGHYTCDVSRQAGGEWLRVDDAAVGSVPEREVVGRKEGRDAYLLFYTRT